MFIKSRKLLAMQLVSLTDGIQLGRIRNLVVDPKALAVVALALEAGGLFKAQRVIPFEAVKSIGEDAVIIEDTNAVTRLSSVPELAPLIRQPANLLGSRVISEDGRFLGSTEEYFFDEQGKIDHFEISSGTVRAIAQGKALLPTAAIRTVGQNSIIVKAEAAKELQWSGGQWNRLQERWNRALSHIKPKEEKPHDPPST